MNNGVRKEDTGATVTGGQFTQNDDETCERSRGKWGQRAGRRSDAMIGYVKRDCWRVGDDKILLGSGFRFGIFEILECAGSAGWLVMDLVL
jgi:hypothetical protein